MRSRSISLSAFIACLLMLVADASASPILYCSSGPGIDLVNDGCISGSSNSYPGGGDGIFSNAEGGDPEAAVEAAILAATGVAVDIELYGKSDANPGLFSFTPNDPSTSSNGDWEVLDKTLIYYITVKASNSFALYELATPSFTGTFDSLGILNNGGQQPNVSHISFWVAERNDDTPPVPEPATILLLGSGAGFLALRRRSGKQS